MRTEIGERLKRQGFRLDLHGAFIRRVELNKVDLENANFASADAKYGSFRGSSFKNADLRGANLEGADLTGADFSGANLQGAILKGADLTDAKNITIEQLDEALIDEMTKLPHEQEAALESRSHRLLVGGSGQVAAAEYSLRAPSRSGGNNLSTRNHHGTTIRESRLKLSQIARLQGYEGEPCSACGNFTLLRNGNFLKCDTCGIKFE